MTEFDLIKHYFAQKTLHRPDVIQGIGDDGAIVHVPAGQELVITTDTLIEGVHFPLATSAVDVGHKALAVNLSDLAAMGATPAWVTLALTLPEANEAWLDDFCQGFFTLANQHHVALIGGDLTHGPHAITIQALGLVPTAQKFLLRSGAKPHDLIYVTGNLGDAGLALRWQEQKISLSQQQQKVVLKKLNRPEPRIALGIQLRHLAHAAIDISDGLAADLNHILEQSALGAILHVDQIPLSNALRETLSSEDAIALALTAGDDYELCFTIPPENRAAVEAILAQSADSYACIGMITKEPGISLHYQDGNHYHGKIQGYQHF